MNIKSFLVKLLPFLWSAATRIWENTPKEQQEQALKAVAFTQIIKDNLTALPAAVRVKIAEATGLNSSLVDLSLVAYAKATNLEDKNPDGVIRWMQLKAVDGLSDLGWNQHWDSIGKAMAVILSGNKIDWLSLMLGLLQVALDIFKKK